MMVFNCVVVLVCVGIEVICVCGFIFCYLKVVELVVCGMEFIVGCGEIFGFLGFSGVGKFII